MNTIGKHGPLVLALIFLYSGLYKVFVPAEPISALIALGTPYWLANTIILLITALELHLGTILILCINLKRALLFSAGLLLVFSGFLAYLSLLAHPPACGCMGVTQIFHSNRHNAVFGLLRNCLMLWVIKLAYDFGSISGFHEADSAQM